MRSLRARSLSHLVIGVSTAALLGIPHVAMAQDTSVPAASPAASPADLPPQQPANLAVSAANPADPAASNEIVVTGIRASLQKSADLKRNAQGVVDAISAEDIGKFPDTNLAESLQRITGVSISRQNGEGQFVTVRGFGPEYNLVTLNGRQMPTAFIGDGLSAPASRSFDFANLASEGVAALEVYKSGRATVESGGIGATINIRSPRPLDKPGMHGSLSAKGVIDTSRNGKDPVTPEISGIFSDTFADDRIGILVNGIYQKRKGSQNSANFGWRDGYLGDENNWGSLAQPGDTRYGNITNHPGPTDVYQVPQNGGYDLVNFTRERINGQAVLQARPTDNLTATVDYTFSQNTVTTLDQSVGVWFNHNNTTSSWTDGPVAGPNFYSEHFNANEVKDLAYSGSLTSSRSINKSLGGNLAWQTPIDGLTITLDGHHSTATSKPHSKLGNSNSVGTAVFGIEDQTIDFTHYLPTISYSMYPGIDPLDASLVTPTGNAFRNSLFKDRINQGQFIGHYENRTGALDFIESLDFGFSYIDNKVRTAYSVNQHDTWGGAGPASDIPDDIFHLTDLPGGFKGLPGASDPNMIQQFYTFDVKKMVALIDSLYGTCGGNGQCLLPYTADRRLDEKTYAPYLQVNGKFNLFGRPAHVFAGVRYENTTIDSSALVPVPNGTRWVSANEFDVIYSGDSAFTTLKGKYHNWLPAVDFDFQPIRNVKLRASYSHTIARADYNSLQGGQTVDQLFRIANGTGSQGNPGLLPYKSKNIDLSAEWYYTPTSYLSIAYFHKRVSNFIGTNRIDSTAFGLTNPADGPRYQAAIAALGANATTTDIRNYIFQHYPESSNAATGEIFGLPEDNPLDFQISEPYNSDQKATIHGWEFGLQHNFWDTGFGVILNYTIVDGSAKYNNTLPASVVPGQFALLGLSDTANVVGFYDKNGIQARIAWDWRAKFLNGGGPNPTYTESYNQLDASASWEFRKNMSVFFEGINLTNSSQRQHQRSTRNVTYVSPGSARYAAGVRVNF